jgi:hypothetical protein
MGDAVRCPTTATSVAGCRGTAINVTGVASFFSKYAAFSVPTAGAAAELRFGQTAGTSLNSTPTAAGANYAMFCAPAATASTAFNAVSFTINALASSASFYLSGYFGVCNAGLVSPALSGCTNWTSATLSLPLATTTSTLSFSYAGAALDGAAIGTRNLCFAAGIANTPSSGSYWSLTAGGAAFVGTASCNAGYYLQGSTCAPCASGSYSAARGATSCTQCAAGTWGAAAGQTSAEAACSECAAGYCLALGSTSATASPCAAGYFCPTFAPLTTQAACPPGYFGPPGTGSATANPCAAGTFSPGGAAYAAQAN